MDEMSDISPYWTPKRQKILEWLLSQAPSLAELYQGAVQLLYDDLSLPGRSRCIAHAVREIRNRLPEVVAGVKGKYLDYKTRLDDIAKEWDRNGLPLNEAMPISVEEMDIDSFNIPVPHEVFWKVASLIKEHRETRERPEETAKRLFVALAPENEDLIDQLRPIIIRWLDITEWFIGRAHDSGRTDSELIDDEFVNNFNSFEKMLGALIGELFFATTEELDEILEEANS